MWRALAIAVALALGGQPSSAADIDDVYVKQGGSAWGQLFQRYFPAAGEFGRSYALIVGIGDYDHHSNLRAPVNDAVRMRDFLRDQAGFDHIVTLTDGAATPERINRLMDVELPKLVKPNDRFLFYFSGHGATRSFAGADKRGYLVLKEAETAEWDRMVAMPRVLDWAENFASARHVLFLLDACFSGLAATQAKSGEHRAETLERLMDPAHLLVTAGTENQESFTVGDRSLFTSAFLQAVQDPNADFTRDGIVSLDEIEIFIKDQLDRQRSRGLDMTPTRWKTRNANNAGDFFFLSPAYLNARAGNPADARLEKGEPVQGKGPASPAGIEFEPVEREAMVTATTAIRAAPTSGSERVATVEKGAIVYIPDRVRGQPWVRVERDGKILGFMLQDNLGSPPPPPPAPPEPVAAEAPAATPLLSAPTVLLSPPDPASAESALSLAPSDWSDIQRSLVTSGFLSGEADGRPGPRTRAAIGAWQGSRGSERSGYLTDEQRSMLLADAQARREQLASKPSPGTVFRDCPDCPEMVVIPAGTFQMGSTEAERAWAVEQGGQADAYKDEQPRHSVTIGYDFAVSRTEITRGQFARFVEATGHKTDGGCYTWAGREWKLESARSWRSPGFEQTDDHPVVCVSWQDAQSYVRWLSSRVREPYRLLSEAEWEYAARGRTDTFRYWGDDRGNTEACAYANATDQAAEVKFSNWTVLNCSDRAIYTAPVGSYKNNSFMLKDMLGNAWEWLEDCYHDTYNGAPGNGSAWTSGCSEPPSRVRRGGSWVSPPGNLRSADRLSDAPVHRFDFIGFRVAKRFTP